MDYHGRPQQASDMDPIDIVFTNPKGQDVPTFLSDQGNGIYELRLTPMQAGLHKLVVNILNRPIRGSPFVLNVRQAQKRIWAVKEGVFIWMDLFGFG